MDLRLGDISILKHLLDWRHTLAELGHAELFELGARDIDVEIFSLC